MGVFPTNEQKKKTWNSNIYVAEEGRETHMTKWKCNVKLSYYGRGDVITKHS